jgi:hypothetical protein
MEVNRMISSSIWKDDFVGGLDAEEKLLFFYLLTNAQTSIAGVYKLSVRYALFDTGLSENRFMQIMSSFETNSKIFVVEGYVILPNFPKHQRLNPNMKKAVIKTLADLPDSVKSSEPFRILSDNFRHYHGISSETKPLAEDKSEAEFKDENKDEDKMKILEAYRTHCKPPLFRRIPVLYQEHNALISEFIREFPSISDAETLFQKAAVSTFLTGGGKTGFKATFEWLLKPANARKVLNGDYDDAVDKELKIKADICYRNTLGNCGTMRYGQSASPVCAFCTASAGEK